MAKGTNLECVATKKRRNLLHHKSSMVCQIMLAILLNLSVADILKACKFCFFIYRVAHNCDPFCEAPSHGVLCDVGAATEQLKTCMHQLCLVGCAAVQLLIDARR